MARITKISTINIKPKSLNATNVKPLRVSTNQYAAKIDSTDNNRFGMFKFAEKTFGVTTEYSVGQKMPKIDTKEL